jgi:hypothetical protein
MYANLFLLLGLADTGHLVGVTDASQRYAIYHQIQESLGETYVTDAIETNAYLFKEKDWYVSSGLKLGLEHHYQSVLYDRRYATLTPKVSIGTRRPDINFAVGLEFGKAFWSLTKDRVGKDVKGYNETTSALFSVSLSVDKFLKSNRKDD